MNLFVKNLNYLFKKFDVTQKELASYMNKSQSTIANWRDGISAPDVKELIQIIQFFGLSADILLMGELEKGNLIADDDVKKFKQKGNLIGNPIGILNSKKSFNYSVQEPVNTVVNEGHENIMFLVLQELRRIGQIIDTMQLPANPELKKADK